MEAVIKGVKLSPPVTASDGTLKSAPTVTLTFELALKPKVAEMLSALGNSEWADIELEPKAGAPVL